MHSCTSSGSCGTRGWRNGSEHTAKPGKSITFYDQCRGLTEIRQADSEFSRYHAQVQRSVLNKLDKAFKSFFRRVKRGEKPGFPRFRGRNRAVRSFDIPSPVIHRSGKYHVLVVKGIGRFRFRYRPGMEGLPVKSARVVRTPCRVYVQLVVENRVIRDRVQAPVGIDLGITNRVTLSNGDRYGKRVRGTQRLKWLQRSLARKQRGSNSRDKARRMLAREHPRVALSERNATHRMTTALVRQHSNRFFVEGLNIRGMVRHHKLVRSIHEQTWAVLVSQLTYKAENAGGWVRSVDPRNTSQACSECGCAPDRRLTLVDRTYWCGHCGYEADRDVNAARNILSVGWTGVSLSAGRPGGNAPAHGKDANHGGLVEPPHRAEQWPVNQWL